MVRVSKTPVPDRKPIFVKVARTGDSVQEVCLNGGRTIADALEAGGFESGSEDRARVNGVAKPMDYELKGGEIVTVAGRISGGYVDC